MTTALTQIELPGYKVIVPNQAYEQVTTLPQRYIAEAQAHGLSGDAHLLVTLDKCTFPRKEEVVTFVQQTAQEMVSGQKTLRGMDDRTINALLSFSGEARRKLADGDKKFMTHLMADHYEGDELREGMSYVELVASYFTEGMVNKVKGLTEQFAAALPRRFPGISPENARGMAYCALTRSGFQRFAFTVRLQEGVLPAMEKLEHLLIEGVRDAPVLSINCDRTVEAYARTASLVRILSSALAAPESMYQLRDTSLSAVDVLAAHALKEGRDCLDALAPGVQVIRVGRGSAPESEPEPQGERRDRGSSPARLGGFFDPQRMRQFAEAFGIKRKPRG